MPNIQLSNDAQTVEITPPPTTFNVADRIIQINTLIANLQARINPLVAELATYQQAGWTVVDGAATFTSQISDTSLIDTPPQSELPQ